MSERHSRTLLIVEDEFLIRMMLAETLADEGFEIAEAGTGDEATRLLRDNPAIDLMITDITLPGGMDGLALAKAARDLRPGLPIVFVTGRPDAIGADMLQPRDAVVAKPYLPSEVATAVRRLLEM